MRPDRKPECWFSHDAAHMITFAIGGAGAAGTEWDLAPNEKAPRAGRGRAGGGGGGATPGAGGGGGGPPESSLTVSCGGGTAPEKNCN